LKEKNGSVYLSPILATAAVVCVHRQFQEINLVLVGRVLGTSATLKLAAIPGDVAMAVMFSESAL
jgi:hypothetical protein